MDLSLPKNRDGSDSEWEDIDDDIEEADFKKERTYALTIRHVCDSCENVLHDLISQGELEPLTHANVCPSCNHKSMHQPYYNICSICVRILRKCALCCGDYNEDHIDPRDILLTPCLRSVLDVFPDPYQRRLIRFIFTKWEYFLDKKDVKLDEFRTEFMKMSFSFVKEIEIKKNKRDEEKLKLGLKVNKCINEEMQRIKNELNAMTAEEMAELRQIEEELNSDLIQSCQTLKSMEFYKTKCDKNTSPNMPIHKNTQGDKNTFIGESSKIPIFKNTQSNKNTSMGESSKMSITTQFNTYNNENYEEEVLPPEPFEISLSDEDIVDWNDSNSLDAPENMPVNQKKSDQSNPDDKSEEGDIKGEAKDKEQKRHLPDGKPEEGDKEVGEEDIEQIRRYPDDKLEAEDKKMQKEDKQQKRPDDEPEERDHKEMQEEVIGQKPEEVDNKEVQKEDEVQQWHHSDDKPEEGDHKEMQEEVIGQKPEEVDNKEVQKEDEVQQWHHSDDKPEEGDHKEMQEEVIGQKPEEVDNKEVQKEDEVQQWHHSDDKPEEGDHKEMQEEVIGQKPEEVDNKEVQKEDEVQQWHHSDDKPEEGDHKEMQEEVIGQKPEEVDNKEVQKEDEVQQWHHSDDKPEEGDHKEMQEEVIGQKPEEVDNKEVQKEDKVQQWHHSDDKPEEGDNREVKEDKGQKRQLSDAEDDVSIKPTKKTDFKRVDPIETRRARKKKEYSDFLDEAAMKQLRAKRARKSDPDFTAPGCSGESKKRGRPKGSGGRKNN